MVKQQRHVSRFVKEKLIFAYSLSNNPEAYKSSILDYFVQYKNPKYIKQLQIAFEDNWTQVKKSCIDQLEQIEPDEDKQYLLAKFFYEIGDTEKLLATFRLLEDLAVAMSVDREIIKLYPDEVIDAYFDKSCIVLDNFVGQAASNKIKSLLSHIENVADYQLRSKLFKRIKNHYLHRPQLLEELMSIV